MRDDGWIVMKNRDVDGFEEEIINVITFFGGEACVDFVADLQVLG